MLTTLILSLAFPTLYLVSCSAQGADATLYVNPVGSSLELRIQSGVNVKDAMVKLLLPAGASIRECEGDGLFEGASFVCSGQTCAVFIVRPPGESGYRSGRLSVTLSFTGPSISVTVERVALKDPGGRSLTVNGTFPLAVTVGGGGSPPPPPPPTTTSPPTTVPPSPPSPTSPSPSTPPPTEGEGGWGTREAAVLATAVAAVSFAVTALIVTRMKHKSPAPPAPQALAPPSQRYQQVICPRCGYPNRPGARYCVRCGQALPTAAQIVCPNCGAVNRPGARYCVRCGAKLS